MTNQPKINVRKTRHQVRPYYATMKGQGAFGTGNTPDEARACLLDRIARFSREQKRRG